MTQFLSGCGIKRFFFLPLVAVALFSVSLENCADAAGCGWFCGGSWYVHYASPTPTVSKEVPKTSMASNAGCRYQGEPLPTGKCEIASGTTSVVNWEILESILKSVIIQEFSESDEGATEMQHGKIVFTTLLPQRRLH